MGKYLKLFQEHSGYTAYTQDDSFKKPNVSFCVEQEHVHFSELKLITISVGENMFYESTYINGIYNGNASLNNLYGISFEIENYNSGARRTVGFKKDELSYDSATNGGVRYKWPTVQEIGLDSEIEWIRSFNILLEGDTIPAYAFYDAINTTIEIKYDGVITIGTQAFGHSTQMYNVYLQLTPPLITSHYSNYFNNSDGTELRVSYPCPPYGTTVLYNGDPNWNGISSDCQE